VCIEPLDAEWLSIATDLLGIEFLRDCPDNDASATIRQNPQIAATSSDDDSVRAHSFLLTDGTWLWEHKQRKTTCGSWRTSEVIRQDDKERRQEHRTRGPHGLRPQFLRVSAYPVEKRGPPSSISAGCPCVVREQRVKPCKTRQLLRLSLWSFPGLSLPSLHGMPDCFSLITQRSVVQIHPLQPKLLVFQALP
jgi:hypothetical protein